MSGYTQVWGALAPGGPLTGPRGQTVPWSVLAWTRVSAFPLLAGAAVLLCDVEGAMGV